MSRSRPHVWFFYLHRKRFSEVALLCIVFIVYCYALLTHVAARPAQAISTNCISISSKQWRELCDVLEIEHALVQL